MKCAHAYNAWKGRISVYKPFLLTLSYYIFTFISPVCYPLFLPLSSPPLSLVHTSLSLTPSLYFSVSPFVCLFFSSLSLCLSVSMLLPVLYLLFSFYCCPIFFNYLHFLPRNFFPVTLSFSPRLFSFIRWNYG